MQPKLRIWWANVGVLRPGKGAERSKNGVIGTECVVFCKKTSSGFEIGAEVMDHTLRKSRKRAFLTCKGHGRGGGAFATANKRVLHVGQSGVCG